MSRVIFQYLRRVKSYCTMRARLLSSITNAIRLVEIVPI